MAIWLCDMALDRWRLAHPDSDEGIPLALVSETAHGARIDHVNRACLEAGARIGMALADARALCPHIHAVPSDPDGDYAFLEGLALWAQRWGPWSALDRPDGVLVDVTASAHLFGGEKALLHEAQDMLAKRCLRAHLAIAPTAGAAWATSRYRTGDILTPDNADMRLASLPIAALRLDENILTVLRRLGLKRIADLAGIGRDAVKRRFRNSRSAATNPLLRLDQIMGRVPEPLLPVLPVYTPMVQRRVLEPIRHRALLERVLADLVDDMASLLEGRKEGARRLELGLWRVDGQVIMRALEMAAASRDRDHICRLFAPKLDGIDAGFGIEMMRLRASWSEAMAAQQSDLVRAESEQGVVLATFIDRLVMRMGAKAVRRPVLHHSYIPERAQRWCDASDASFASLPHGQGEMRFHARPIKLLDKAELIAVLYATPDGYPQRFRWRGRVYDIARFEGPERIAPEWWRARAHVRLRDYYRVEATDGRRYWIYRDGIMGDGRGGIPDWYVHGLFA